MNSLFSARPRVLSDVVRNIVIGRALAGAYDARETPRQAMLACRAAARQKLGVQRLNPAQADEVDALVAETRAQTFEKMNPALRGTMPADALQALQASATPNASAPTESETSKAILATLVRLEKMIAMLLALCFNRVLGSGKGSGNEPALPLGSNPMADAWRSQQPSAQLPAWHGSAIPMPQANSHQNHHQDASSAIVVRDTRSGSVQSAQLVIRGASEARPAPAPRKETQLARWNGTELVVHGEDLS